MVTDRYRVSGWYFRSSWCEVSWGNHGILDQFAHIQWSRVAGRYGRLPESPTSFSILLSAITWAHSWELGIMNRPYIIFPDVPWIQFFFSFTSFKAIFSNIVTFWLIFFQIGHEFLGYHNHESYSAISKSENLPSSSSESSFLIIHEQTIGRGWITPWKMVQWTKERNLILPAVRYSGWGVGGLLSGSEFSWSCLGWSPWGSTIFHSPFRLPWYSLGSDYSLYGQGWQNEAALIKPTGFIDSLMLVLRVWRMLHRNAWIWGE